MDPIFWAGGNHALEMENMVTSHNLVLVWCYILGNAIL